MRYNNYHRHDHQSNIRTLDCVVKPEDYINRIKELNHNTLSTTQHGWAGNYLEYYDLCQKANIKMLFGAELYLVKNRFEKDATNSHIILIGKNQDSVYELNGIMSESNKTGFYYKPRIDLELLLSLNPNNFIVTSACIIGMLKNEECIETFLEPVYKHFGNNFYLEIQSHPNEKQALHNKIILNLHDKYKIPIIHANDSHYILPEDSEHRDKFLQGKGFKYEEENGFILDYPDYQTILERYSVQSILTPSQAKEALQNTLIFDECENLYFDKNVKMPTIYPNEDSNKKLQTIIAKKWREEKPYVNPNKIKEYEKGIQFEYDIISKTNMSDYFLLNERIIDKAVKEYDGILTRTGRGSAVSFYINKLLGFTEIDRFESEVPLYPTRFMSISRILESKSLPDIDFNFADVEAPIKAAKDILGEDSVYYMYAIGKMQESSAFRNLCRAYDIPMDEYNEIGKNLDAYRNHTQWKPIIDESQKYIGTIESISPSPCSFILSDKPLSKELGLIKVGDILCACIDGYTADVWKYLKNDFLIVKVWKIISNTFKVIGKPIPNIRELKTLLDDKVWDLYEKGLTATLNQVDTDMSTSMVKRYKPKSVADLSAFVAAIRPGFASLVNTFLNRQEYSNGVEAIDELLKPSFNFMLYQESIMAFLVWCGLKEDYTYDIIKKIAKKKFTDEEIEKLKQELLEGYIKNVGDSDKFNEVWQVVEDAAKYSFNASHSLSVAWDSIYGAYLKANYPLEYFTVVLNEWTTDTEKTSKIISELQYFDIKLNNIRFRKSKAEYAFDKESKTIYKGIESIKWCNIQIAEELFELSQKNKYTNFIDLLADIKQTSINSRQLKILTILNFFSEFGKNKKLLQAIELYDNLASRKQIKFTDIEKLGLNEDLLKSYSKSVTEKMYKDIDLKSYIYDIYKTIPNKTLSVKEQIKFEMEYLEYCIYTNPEAPPTFYIVTNYETYKDKTKPYITLYNIYTGEVKKTKVKDGRAYCENPFNLFSILKIKSFKSQFKSKMVNGKWQKSDELEDILYEWEVY